MKFVKYMNQHNRTQKLISHSPVLDACPTEHVSTRQSAGSLKNDVASTYDALIEFGIHVYPRTEDMFVEPCLHA